MHGKSCYRDSDDTSVGQPGVSDQLLTFSNFFADKKFISKVLIFHLWITSLGYTDM